MRENFKSINAWERKILLLETIYIYTELHTCAVSIEENCSEPDKKKKKEQINAILGIYIYGRINVIPWRVFKVRPQFHLANMFNIGTPEKQITAARKEAYARDAIYVPHGQLEWKLQ